MVETSSRRLAAVALLLFVVLAGCGSPTSPDNHRLRIANVGAVAIDGLTILFPSETATLGSVAVGSTSSYVDVSRGVYSYSAFRFVVDGAVIQQPVIDWTGEEPLDGEAFTYSLELMVAAQSKPFIRIVRVERDR